MKSIVFSVMVGLLIGLAFATVIAYWVPVPHRVRTAWIPEMDPVKNSLTKKPAVVEQRAAR